jgi:hypothetical protein
MHLKRLLKNGDPLTRRKTANGEALQFFEATVAPYRGDDCLIWPYNKDRHGYGRLMAAGKNKSVARMACEAINGPPPEANLDAAHNCGSGHMGCVAPSHLRWATRKENVADTLLHGTRNRGSRNGCAKLSEGDVRAIRVRAKADSHEAIARDYGVARVTVTDIVSRRNWRWLPDYGSSVTGGGLY